MQRTVEVSGIPVAYEERGDGSPVLLIHGWSADRRYLIADLEPVFEERPGWRRIYLDLPGHGATPAPVWLGTQAQMMEILQAFVDAAVGEARFAVGGNSYGGYLTLGLVRALAPRLRGAALLVPDLPASDGSRDLPDPVTLEEDPSVFEDLAPDEAWIPEALVAHERRMLEEIRAYDMPGYRASDRAFLARLERDYLLPAPVAIAAAPFERPSVILAGRQDATVGFRRALGLVDEFPRATVAAVDLAGHHLGRIERPALFRALIADWLERMDREGSHA